jgi:hypothetical protein
MGLLTLPMQVKKDGAEMVTEFHHGVMALAENLAFSACRSHAKSSPSSGEPCRQAK